jgi:site-specific recombinase XerD
MGVVQREEINPGLPSRQMYLVRLANSGQNWYMRIREKGRYRHKSLKTDDLTEARRAAVYNPPDSNKKTSATIKRALLDFLESRQQLIDAPSEDKPIRDNTFKTYKARVKSLISYFDQARVVKKELSSRTVGSLREQDFAGYKHWRERSGIMVTTIKAEISQINTILGWFYDNEYIDERLVIKLPKVDPDKLRPANRLPSSQEIKLLQSTLKKLCENGDIKSQRNWRLYKLWLQWLEETYTRPHECRLLKISDVTEIKVDGITAVQFYTSSTTKTGKRLVYASSNVKSELIALYREWRLRVTADSDLFILPSSGKCPCVSWFSDKWKKLIKETGLKVVSRELTQYSFRHEGINNLLTQGVAPTKVADLAGHSLQIQQRIYKKYQLENDHSVLRRDDLKNTSLATPTGINADIPYPWEIDEETGEWFPDDILETMPNDELKA